MFKDILPVPAVFVSVLVQSPAPPSQEQIHRCPIQYQTLKQADIISVKAIWHMHLKLFNKSGWKNLNQDHSVSI